MDGAGKEIPMDLFKQVEQVDSRPCHRLHTACQNALARNDPIRKEALALQDPRGKVHDDAHVHDCWRIASLAADDSDCFGVHGIV
eukprot:13197527-Heterocapsa_arctica.AAC.1